MKMTKQEIDEALEHRRSIVHFLRQRLQQRELQEAQYGLNVPPEVTNEIRNLQQRIQRIEDEIAKLELSARSSRSTQIPSATRQGSRGIKLLISLIGTSLVLALLIISVLVIRGQSLTDSHRPGGEALSASTTSISIISATPKDAVYKYYEAISEGKYDIAWGMLTPAFRTKNNSDGYEPYAAWWSNEGRVEVLELDAISQTDSEATMQARLNFVTKNGVHEFRIYLIFDDRQGSWLFNDACEIPYTCTE